MTDLTVSRLGQANATGDADALFLKVFAGEVLTAFETQTVMKDKHYIRTIDSGKSAQFPATWKATARYHTPGNAVLGNQVKHNERTILVDDLLISDTFIADIDDAKNHYDVRSIYTGEQGIADANEFDKKTLQVAVLAARASATVTGGSGGSVLDKGATVATTVTVLEDALMDAAQAMDEKDVPEMDRVAILRPAHYYLLANSTKLVNADYEPLQSNGSYARAQVKVAANMSVFKSNNLPNSVIAANTGENNTYSGTFSDTIAACFHKSAVGTVKLMDLSMQMTGEEFKAMYQGTLMVGRYAMGHGILRPECAVEITKA